MSYTESLYHIIIRTKNKKRSLSIEYSELLYKYIWGIINQKKSKLYRINGMEDHIHMLVSIHPTIALADFVRDIKRSSSIMLKMTKGYERFDSWSKGYASFTYSLKDKQMICNYIKKQREHHKTISFKEEIEAIYKDLGIEFDQSFWDE